MFSSGRLPVTNNAKSCHCTIGGNYLQGFQLLIQLTQLFIFLLEACLKSCNPVDQQRLLDQSAFSSILRNRLGTSEQVSTAMRGAAPKCVNNIPVISRLQQANVWQGSRGCAGRLGLCKRSRQAEELGA